MIFTCLQQPCLFFCLLTTLNIFFSHKDPEILLRTVNSQLQEVADWIKANKLSLNLLKTNYMLFSNIIDNLPGNIVLDNTVIQKVSSTKFLGIIVDDKLSWKLHVDNVCKIISRNIGILNKVKLFFPSRILLNLYSTLVLPYLNYGILAWGTCGNTQLNRILLLQKKAMRIICHTNFRAHTNELFHANNVLKIHDLFSYNLGIFMYTLEKNELPQVLSNMFNKNTEFHSYPTRIAKCYHLPKPRTQFSSRIFTFTGPKYWNALPGTLQEKPSLSGLKNALKHFLLQTNQNK